jgi:tetratricopeptide (TPR) repeat protein
MAIEGRLEAVGLADICQLLSMGRKTGCLTVTDRSNFGYVYFQGGRVTFATVLNRPDRLGEVLVRSGVIAREDLAAAMEEQLKTPGHRLGQILLAQGKLTQEQLRQFVSVQIQEAVFHLFGWESGEFHFEPGRRPDADESLLVSLNAESLLLEGARRVDELSLIQKKVPSTDLIFRDSTEPGGKRKGEVELTPEQQAVLPLLDGMRTVDDVVLDSGLVEFEVMKAIYGLVQAGLAHTEGDRRESSGPGTVGTARELDLADAFYRAGMLEDAEVHYRSVLEADPTEAHAHERLAVIALRTHRPEEALRHLSEGPEAGSLATLRNRALALELLGRNDEALEALGKAEELDPDDLQVTLARGILFLKSGKAAEATEAFRRYRQASPSEKSPSAMYFAFAILAAAAAGDVPQAIRIGREGLTLYPASCPVLVNLGLVLERAGEMDAAEALYLRAVQRSSPPPQAHKNLGDLAYRRGDEAGARAHYERAVKLNPALGDDTYLKLGELAYKEGDSSEARVLWQRALELNPRNEVVRTNLALVAEVGDG